MRGLLPFIRANLLIFFRDRTAVFWSFLFPIILMGLLGLAFGRADALQFSVAVLNEDGTTWSDALRTALADEELPFAEREYASVAAARADLEAGDLDLVIVIPAGFGAFLDGQLASGGANNSTLEVPIYWGQDAQGTGAAGVDIADRVISGFFKGATQTRDRLTVRAEAVNAESLEFIDYMAPGIVAMAVMQNGVFGLSLFLVSARERKILKRLQATPVNAGFLLLGRIFPALVVAFIQTGLLLSLAVFGFGVRIVGDFLVLALVVAFGAVVFITLGFLISSVSKTVDSAEGLTNVITLPMFFLGGVFIPIDRLPAAIQAIANAMPLTYFSNSLRDIMLRGAGLGDIALNVGILSVFALLMFAAASKLFRWE